MFCKHNLNLMRIDLEEGSGQSKAQVQPKTPKSKTSKPQSASPTPLPEDLASQMQGLVAKAVNEAFTTFQNTMILQFKGLTEEIEKEVGKLVKEVTDSHNNLVEVQDKQSKTIARLDQKFQSFMTYLEIPHKSPSTSSKNSKPISPSSSHTSSTSSHYSHPLSHIKTPIGSPPSSHPTPVKPSSPILAIVPYVAPSHSEKPQSSSIPIIEIPSSPDSPHTDPPPPLFNIPLLRTALPITPITTVPASDPPLFGDDKRGEEK